MYIYLDSLPPSLMFCPKLARQLLSQPSKPHTHTLRTFTTTPTLTMRVPYAPKEAPTEEARPVYERIAARRNPRPLIPLDLALLHNPSVADGWSSFIGAIRTKTSVPDTLKELAISRIAALNHAVHEWDVHAALAVKAGVSRDVMQVVFTAPVVSRGAEKKTDGDVDAGLEGLSEEEKAVLQYTDQMTVGVQVDDGVAQRLKGFLSDTQVVELTATVAAYNCVSRFLVALDVGECNGREMKKVADL
jgi:alkylhydroperoxidase family enzyme